MTETNEFVMKDNQHMTKKWPNNDQKLRNANDQ